MAPLNPLCDRVIDLASEEYALPRNLKEDVESLASTAILINAVLHDAEEKEAKGEAVRVWLRQLKQIFLDAEDILDEVATDARLHRSKIKPLRISGHHDMARQIKAIRLKLDHKWKQKNRLGLRTSAPREYKFARQPTGSLMASDGSYFSGRDEEREKMIHVLLRWEEVVESNVRTGGVEVLVIHGVGGVGKTTLAQLLFNDPRVKEHFQLRMWVCVTEDFDVKRITREIMEATLSSAENLLETSNVDVQQRRLKEKIEDKRFLLVLDDLWEEDNFKWETLCTPLSYGAKGSKIMVTTRKQKTLTMVNGISFLLEVMSSEALWPIFRRYAFGNEEPSGKMQLENVGREIVEKLKGLPLAARVIGRVLNERLDVDHWTYILKSEIFTSQRDDILPVLKLSYDHLLVPQKQCFAYCSLFPKDYIFSKDGLISMWMAQNFIPNTSDLYAERVGCEIVKDLLNKSFFELDVKSSPHESFKMHDLIHDLAESISEDDCFRMGDDDQKQMSENVRHVSIATDSFDLSKLMKVLNRENLRTLVFLHQNTFQLTPHLDDLFVKLKRLRILGLQRCKIEHLPSSIGKLKHLRFVDLSETLISNLPDSMSNLHNLQVLKLKGCERLGALPRNTSALVNLKHLELDTEIASQVQGLGKLTALQELIVTGNKVRELADMSMLKELRIWGLEGVVSKEEAIQARLEAKEHLKLLELKWGSDNWPRQQTVSEEEVVDALKPMYHIRQLYVRSYEGARSPKWMGDLSWISTSLLEELELCDCKKWEVLPPLGQLPVLKFLRISRMWGVRRIGPKFFCCCNVGRGGGGGVNMTLGFPSLEELAFVDMPEWEEWESVDEQRDFLTHPPPLLTRRRGHFLLPPLRTRRLDDCFLPRLRTLRLEDCPKLRELPPLPPTLTTLFLRCVGITRLPGWMMQCCDSRTSSDVTPPASSSSSSSRFVMPSRFDDGSHMQPILSMSDDWSFTKRPLPSSLEFDSLPDGLYVADCPKPRKLPPLPPTGIPNSPRWRMPPASSSSLSSSPSLSSFMIYDCPNLTSLDGGLLQRPLRMLKKLTISRCSELASLPDGLFRHFGSLEQLEVAGCPKLSWPPPSATEKDALLQLGILIVMDEHVDGLTSLKSLTISNCAAITTLPPLRRLSALEVLRIRSCAELRSLGFSAHVFIGALEIVDCPKLFHLVERGGAAVTVSSPSAPSPVKHASTVAAKISVKTLTLWSCSAEQIATWLRQVSSLQALFIQDSPWDGVDGDLEGALLDLAPSLRRLSLSDCENLSSLPSKLRSLSCLEGLWIACCPKIERLPSAGLPETLKLVSIWLCPELEERCREEGCPDWPLLSHVPTVRIGFRS